MKYIIFCLSFALLFSCVSSGNDEIQRAKDEIFSNDTASEKTESVSDNSDIINDKADNISEVVNNEKSNYFNIEYNTSEQLIWVKPFWNLSNIWDWVEFDWYVNDLNIDKITVHYKKSDSPYTLQTFKKWDDKFTYRAFRRFNAFWDGLNTYEINAFIWNDMVTSLTLEIYYSWEENNVVKNEKTTPVVENNTASVAENNTSALSLKKDNIEYKSFSWFDFPVSWELWEFVIDNENISYSNVSNFIINTNRDFENLDCQNVWDYIKTQYSWYYWNTCREVWDDKILVNVLSLNGNRYSYERHYFINWKWLMWKILLESWFWIDGSNISEKNAEFRDKEFPILEKTDFIFNNINY